MADPVIPEAVPVDPMQAGGVPAPTALLPGMVPPNVGDLFAALKQAPDPNNPLATPDLTADQLDPIERTQPTPSPAYEGRTAYRQSRGQQTLQPWMVEQPVGMAPLDAPPAPNVGTPGSTTAKVLEAKTTTQALDTIGIPKDDIQRVAAGHVLGLLGQRIAQLDQNSADPDGHAGATWELAGIQRGWDQGWFSDAKTTGAKVLADHPSTRFRSLYSRFVTRPASLQPDESNELAGLMAQVAEATRSMQDPEMKGDDNMRVVGIDFDPGGYAVPLFEVKDMGGRMVEQVNATPLPATTPVSEKRLDGVGLASTPSGLAVLARSDNTALDTNARVLYPAGPTSDAGTVARWLKRRPEPSLARSRELARRLTGEAGEDPVQVEVHLPSAPTPATVAGNHAVVLVDNVNVMRKLESMAGHRGLKVTKLPPVEVQQQRIPTDEEHDPGPGISSTGTDAAWIRLPDDLKAEDTNPLVQALLATGATRPVVYVHHEPAGFTPVREHHYVDPSGFKVIGRSRSGDTAAPHSYPAWMLEADASALPAEHGAKPAAPVITPDGNAVIDDRVTVHYKHLLEKDTDKAEIKAPLFASTVAGKSVHHFVVEADPTRPFAVSLGHDEATAQAGGVKGVAGKITPKSLELTVPVRGGGIDLEALSETIWFLKRYGGSGIRFDKMRLLGNDGRTYDFNGQVAS